MHWLLIFLGGGFGSILRYSISIGTINYNKTDFPLATFIANIASCFLVGLLYHYLPKTTFSETGRYLLVTGFCGGFSTFSTFSIETIDLLQKNNWMMAVTYVIASFLCDLLAVWVGMQVLK
jgi:fluoride exporter